MNDLQLAMIGAGAVAVAAVWGANKWQERQHKKLAEKAFKGGQADVLMGSQEAQESGDLADDAPLRQEPVLSSENGSAAPVEPPPLPVQYADDIADCIVRIEFMEPVAAAHLLESKSRWAAQIGKPMFWLGLDDEAGAWYPLSSHDGSSYKTVCASLQLVDRQGAILDAELSVFLNGVWELASQYAGITSMPKHDEVLAAARELDSFCAEVDLQLGVKVVCANGPVTGARLQQLMETAGLSLRDDGAFHDIDTHGLTRFTLTNIDGEPFSAAALDGLLHGITLSMDVPRVPEGPAAFDALVATAKSLSKAIDGALVDSQGNPLGADMIATIRAKIGEMQALLADRQIVAGGTRALRLFS
jgi:FtsZ-interacting cell division protein ZipA